MAKLRESVKQELQEIVLRYFQGQALNVTRVRLEAQAADNNIDCIQLYKAIPIDKENPCPYTLAILKSLNIGPEGHNKEKYQRLLKKSDTLYKLLKNLSYDGLQHAKYLTELINSTKKKRSFTKSLIIASIISLPLAALAYFKKEWFNAAFNWIERQFPNFVDWLGKTLSVLKNLAVLGIIYNGLSLIASWVNTFRRGTETNMGKISALIFKSIGHGLNIGAYTLSYLAAGLITAPAAALFIMGAFVDVLKGSIALVKNYLAYFRLRVPEENAPWEVQAEHIRAENTFKSYQRSLIVKIVSAFFLTGIVAAWCLFPPSLPVTITCMLSMVLVTLTKNSILGTLKQAFSKKLQKELEEKNEQLSEDGLGTDRIELSPLNAKNNERLVALSQREQKVSQEEERLKAREDRLKVREEQLGRFLEKASTGSSERILRELGGQQEAESLRSLAENDGASPVEPGISSNVVPLSPTEQTAFGEDANDDEQQPLLSPAATASP